MCNRYLTEEKGGGLINAHARSSIISFSTNFYRLNSPVRNRRVSSARVHFILHKRSKTASYKIRRDAASLLAEFEGVSTSRAAPTVPKSATKRSPFNPWTLTTGTSDDLAIRKIGPHYEIIVILLYEWGGGE